MPALDARQVEEVNVLNGRNFLIDAEGPYSAFGTDLITYQKIAEPEGNATFRVDGEIFHFTAGAVLAYDSVAGYYYPLITFTDDGSIAPWFHTIVGGIHYFAKKGVGLLRYAPNSNSWSLESGGDYPAGIVSVAESEDRLIILGTEYVAWSAVSDGTNVTTDIDTGAGRQALTLISGGNPYAVLSVTDGFITITDRGSMKSQLVNTQTIFRHESMDIESHVPINPFAICSIGGDSLIWLTKVGFVTTTGKHPVVWQPLMSEYFTRKLMPTLDLTKPSVITMHYNHDRQLVFVSIGTNANPRLYTYAFALYLPRDEWGIFSHTHTAFGEINIAEGSDAGFNFGYLSEDGSVNAFNDVNRVQAVPDLSEFDGIRHTTHEILGRFDGDILRTSTNLNLSSWDRNAYPNIYNIYPNFTPTQGSIDAYVDVGLFRLVNNQDNAIASQIYDLTIGMNDDIDVENEDWLLLSGDEDWLTETGDEDWGLDFLTDVDYDVSVIPTLDGKKAWQNQLFTGMIIREDGAVRFYDIGGSIGIYQIVRIEALETSQSFHLKLLDVTAILAGEMIP